MSHVDIRGDSMYRSPEVGVRLGHGRWPRMSRGEQLG